MPDSKDLEGLDALTEIMRNSTPWGEEPLSEEVLAKRRRRRFRRRVGALITVVVVLALAGTYASLALTAPISAASPDAHAPNVTTPAAATIALPAAGQSAVSVTGADDYLGTIPDGILAENGTSAMPMASISKLITALVILNAKPLGASGTGPTLTFDKADAKLYDKYYVLGATIAAMPAGSTMTEHDAIETMLVVSACNYAEALTDWAFGSNAAFVHAAKTWMASHGLSDTTMVEPTGIDARNTSTPRDLIAVGKLALADPALAAIVAKTHLGDLGIPALTGMSNTNDLIGTDGINGIKTGTLDPGGTNLLFSAKVDVGISAPLTVVGVVLGGGSHSTVDDGAKGIIASLKAGFHTVQLGKTGQAVGSYSTPWGAKATMVLADSASALTWSNTPITSTMTMKPLKTGHKGEQVGTVTWVAGTTTVTVPVVLDRTIASPSAWWRLTHPEILLSH
ncbi:MAG TPA: D-alanyl-D-alanine carboxypeptidase [Pseudolysinimonas sp.]|nr:D-alanyl-D-alanine carboxypeptidase [Pseudolysinimonas sp.]